MKELVIYYDMLVLIVVMRPIDLCFIFQI